LVYGAIALVTAVQTRGFHRAVAICIEGGIILTIVASRLLLEIHSLPEVSLGFVIGTASLILFGRIYLQSPWAKMWPLLVTSGVLIALLHGQELHAEEFLHRVTGYLGVHCR
jgi:membrane-associated phospholipid phosphatase